MGKMEKAAADLYNWGFISGSAGAAAYYRNTAGIWKMVRNHLSNQYLLFDIKWGPGSNAAGL